MKAKENITKFNDAADALTAVHAEVIAKFDEKIGVVKMTVLLSFIEKSRDLRGSAQKL